MVNTFLSVRVQVSTICVPVPLYHCFGMVLGCLQIPVWGAKCVFPSGRFDPALTLHAVQQEKYALLYMQFCLYSQT